MPRRTKSLHVEEEINEFDSRLKESRLWQGLVEKVQAATREAYTATIEANTAYQIIGNLQTRMEILENDLSELKEGAQSSLSSSSVECIKTEATDKLFKSCKMYKTNIKNFPKRGRGKCCGGIECGETSQMCTICYEKRKDKSWTDVLKCLYCLFS